jgi:hypothetical protein
VQARHDVNIEQISEVEVLGVDVDVDAVVVVTGATIVD